MRRFFGKLYVQVLIGVFAGVALGFFYPNPSRFCTTADPIPVPAGTPTPYELCRKLKAGYQSMNPTGSDAATVFAVLDDAIAHTTPSA